MSGGDIEGLPIRQVPETATQFVYRDAGCDHEPPQAPPVDIEAAKNTIRSHVAACYPNEAVGLIVARGRKQEVVCGKNISKTPRHAFLLHPSDYAAAEDIGKIVALYHSHCNEPPFPSPADKKLSEKQRIPVIIVSWPADTWEIYKPTGWRMALEMRPFVFGILDCYTLVQDYYAERLGIELPDFVYADDWRAGAPNVFVDNLPRTGFVPCSNLRPHDVILMALESTVPNHVAVYTGDGMMMHHPPGRLSGSHPYVCERGQYALSTVGFWRHSSLR